MANDQERAAFEAAATKCGFSPEHQLGSWDGEDYEDMSTHIAFYWWRQARAALAAAPVTCQTYGPGTAVPCAECNQTLVDSQELAELRARVAAPQVPAAPQWRPIETAPTDTLVLLYGAKRSEMVVGMKHSRDGWVIDTPSEWAGMYPPTHWMPLPAAPGAPQPAEREPLTDEQLDAAVAAWFREDIQPGHRPFAKRMRAAIEAAHGITPLNAGITGPAGSSA